MATSKLTTYGDTLLFLALLKRINEAKESIEVMSFVFKIQYSSPNRAQAIFDALIAAAARGVRVYVVLNFSQYEPDVCITNYQTGLALAAGGCRVRLGIKGTTLHSKLMIIDGLQVFAGSHNLTRGALSNNREFTIASRSVVMAQRAHAYFLQVWESSVRIAEVQPPSGNAGPVTLRLSGVETAGEEVRLSFTANHVEGVEAFAAVADDDLLLAGAKMGETVYPSERTAAVLPEQQSGTTIFLAVRAYREGTVIAESNVLERVYQPEGTPPGGGGGDDDGGGEEPPPPAPPVAPNLTSVTQTGDTTVTLQWAFAGVIAFSRFELQQRDLQGNWHLIGSSYEASAREWIGTPLAMDAALPFRVVVYNTTAQSAESNMMYLQAAPPPEPLTAPHLESVVAGLNGTEITVTWTFPGCENFHRFEVQKQVGTDWSVVGSTLDPAVRQWVGPGPGEGFTEAMYRVVVFNMAEESAASNEITITGETPVPLTPPVVVSVTQIGPMGINVEYSHVTPAEFTRYEVQQRSNETWNILATITTPETRSWSGGPIPYMDPTHPVRVVVFVQSGDSAGSNEMTITPM